MPEDLFQFILKLIAPLVAVIAASAVFKKHSSFQRLIYWQLLSALLFYLVSYLVTEYQRLSQMPLNNHWVFNVSLFFEFSLLGLSAAQYFEPKKLLRAIVRLLTGLIFLVYVFEISKRGFSHYCNFSDSAECLAFLSIFCIVLYNEFQIHSLNWYRSPELWISLGLIMYFAGSLPYISLFDLLQNKLREQNELLFRIINATLLTLRYILAAFAFFLLYCRKPIVTGIKND